MTGEYRIEYTITTSDDKFTTETEVGFGSSGSWANVEDCIYAVMSDIEHHRWETGRPA